MRTMKRFRIFAIVLLAIAVSGCASKRRDAARITPDKVKSEPSTQKIVVQQTPQAETVAPAKTAADPF